jgi:lipoprotein-releasing system permease protein
MGYEWFVSLRYLRAKRKQTFISVISFISIAGVTLGVAALIVVLAVMTGFHDGVRQQILGNVPHVLIQQQGGAIDGYPQLVKTVRQQVPEAVAVNPFVSKEAMLLARGSDGPPGIVLGLDTASTLGVGLGDTVNVIPPKFNVTPFGLIPKMKPFRVAGIFQHRGGFLDAYFAYVDLRQAQQFLDANGQASGVEIELVSFEQSRQVTQRLRDSLPYPYLVSSWEDLFGSFLSALKLEKLGLFIVLGIIVLVAAFNIATTLIMIVMEKHKDIAILRSMGANSRSILQIFVFQGLIVGSLGTALGTLLGVTLAGNADPIIKGLERLLKVRIFDQAVYGMERFPSVVNADDVIAVALTAMVICLLATIYPAWRASRMDPGEALRYE